MNQTEWRVWDRLRGRKVDGWKFRRQHPIGPYFVDFYCPAARLVIEINGPAHDFDASWAYDQRRTAWLLAEGYRVMTIIAEDVDQDLDGVLDSIYSELLSSGVPTPRLRRVPPREAGR
jgi:very-short-patch-repair endonuclease